MKVTVYILSIICLLLIVGIGALFWQLRADATPIRPVEETTVPDVDSEVERLGARVTSLEARMSTLSNKLDSQGSQLQAFQSQIATLGQNLQQNLNQADRLERELRGQTRGLEKSVTEMRTRVSTIEQALSNVQISLQNLATKNKQHADYLAAIMGAIPQQNFSPAPTQSQPVPQYPISPQSQTPPQSSGSSGSLPIPDSF